jgi:hypothetical protein
LPEKGARNQSLSGSSLLNNAANLPEFAISQIATGRLRGGPALLFIRVFPVDLGEYMLSQKLFVNIGVFLFTS